MKIGIKLLAALVIVAATMTVGFFGAESVSARHAANEEECAEVDGRWQSLGDKCVHNGLNDPGKCKAVNGYWQPNSYSCEVNVVAAGCMAIGGTWRKYDEKTYKCIDDSLNDQGKCKAAGGHWQSNSYACEITPSIGGTSGDGYTYGGTDCNILPKEICGAQDETDLGKSAVWQIVLFVINILTAGVAVLALAGIVYGSVLYSSAGGNPEQVKKAKNIIMNVVIGIIAFGLMYSLLQWIVPGGVFN